MTLLAIPNVSEGNDRARIDGFAGVVEATGVRVLDIHSDAIHNRSVLTLTADPDSLAEGCTALAAACSEIDLTKHRGIHPRLGGLDVCPFVPHGGNPMSEAISTARRTARTIAARSQIPVYVYGEAAYRSETRELPDLRRGGLERLAERAGTDLPPDEGPAEIDPRRGVVCVGARPPLIALNIWLEAGAATAKEIAVQVRSPSVRALGLELSSKRSQVSLNLIDPATTGIEHVFEVVAELARRRGAEVYGTEIVGLVEERFLPNPHARVARLLLQPGHSLEAVLQASG
ncbi:MAG TPA: glutamate formiminotransferase [Actinomycetota bacterium]|nr:glutamate formiminotransferase [Actinomycetota bacterium]